MTNRAIRALLKADGVDITKVDCLYCYKEPGYCRICRGAGKIPAVVQGRLAPIECRNCGGSGACPQCGGKKNKKAHKRNR